jgi:hypothetical protein
MEAFQYGKLESSGGSNIGQDVPCLCMQRPLLADLHVSSLTESRLPFLPEAECLNILQYLTNTQTHGRRHGEIDVLVAPCVCRKSLEKMDWRKYAQDYREWVPVGVGPVTLNVWCRGGPNAMVCMAFAAASRGAYTKIGRCRGYSCRSNY